jgi:hypothetical protein
MDWYWLKLIIFLDKILDKFFKSNNSTVKITIEIRVFIFKNKGKRMSQLEYSWIIRSLMYVMNYIRSNIVYSISKLSRFTINMNKNRSLDNN